MCLVSSTSSNPENSDNGKRPIFQSQIHEARRCTKNEQSKKDCRRSRERCSLHGCWDGKGWGGGAVVGRGQLWVLGLIATIGDSWGYQEGLSFALPSPLPATRASVSPSPRGCAGGWEQWRKRMKHPRAAQGTHLTVPAPTRDPCRLSVLPGARGTPLPLQGVFARSGR